MSDPQLDIDNGLQVTVDADILLGMCEVIISLTSDRLGRQATGNAAYDQETLDAFKEALSLASAWAAGIRRVKSEAGTES